MEGISSEGVATKHISTMKFSTEAIVAAAVALVFALLSFGAIAREHGPGPAPGADNGYVAGSEIKISQVTVNDPDVLGL